MRLEDSGIPGIAGLIDALVAAVSPREGSSDPETRREVAADFTASQYEVNEMQRRGLGNGGTLIAREVNKQLDVLNKIHAVLQKASTDGALTWP